MHHHLVVGDHPSFKELLCSQSALDQTVDLVQAIIEGKYFLLSLSILSVSLSSSSLYFLQQHPNDPSAPPRAHTLCGMKREGKGRDQKGTGGNRSEHCSLLPRGGVSVNLISVLSFLSQNCCSPTHSLTPSHLSQTIKKKEKKNIQMCHQSSEEPFPPPPCSPLPFIHLSPHPTYDSLTHYFSLTSSSSGHLAISSGSSPTSSSLSSSLPTVVTAAAGSIPLCACLKRKILILLLFPLFLTLRRLLTLSKWSDSQKKGADFYKVSASLQKQLAQNCPIWS
jgi:hypothetical protein